MTDILNWQFFCNSGVSKIRILSSGKGVMKVYPKKKNRNLEVENLYFFLKK